MRMVFWTNLKNPFSEFRIGLKMGLVYFFTKTKSVKLEKWLGFNFDMLLCLGVLNGISQGLTDLAIYIWKSQFSFYIDTQMSNKSNGVK